MKYNQRTGRSSSKPVPDPGAKLLQQAIKGRDRGDGQGADWVMAASDALLAAYYCIGQAQAKGDPRLPSLLEHAHGSIYNRWMGNPDDGLAVPVQPRVGTISGPAGPAPGPKDPGRR